VALLDWDGTVRSGFTIVDWTEHLTQQGIFPRNCARELEELLMRALPVGLISHDEAIERAASIYAAALRGIPERDIAAAVDGFSSHDAKQFLPIAQHFRSILHAAGAEIVVISGAPAEPLNAHREWLFGAKMFPLRLGVRGHWKFEFRPAFVRSG
jgi:phosphoserine phosphatase